MSINIGDQRLHNGSLKGNQYLIFHEMHHYHFQGLCTISKSCMSPAEKGMLTKKYEGMTDISTAECDLGMRHHATASVHEECREWSGRRRASKDVSTNNED